MRGWRLTPRELGIEMAGAQRRRMEQWKDSRGALRGPQRAADPADTVRAEGRDNRGRASSPMWSLR